MWHRLSSDGDCVALDIGSLSPSPPPEISLPVFITKLARDVKLMYQTPSLFDMSVEQRTALKKSLTVTVRKCNNYSQEWPGAEVISDV